MFLAEVYFLINFFSKRYDYNINLRRCNNNLKDNGGFSNEKT